MKHILNQIAILMLLTYAARGADYMALTKNQSYTIPAGKVVEVMAFTVSQSLSPGESIGFRVNGMLTLKPTPPDGTRLPGPTNLFIPGPTVISVDNLSNPAYDFYLSYRVFNNSDGTNLPTNTVVIPSDATGPVNIILESSSDLITWTAANPGSYGSSTEKRFFRVRAQNQ
jgi:hypothetical protein